jgi:hypothetical protein
MPAALQEILDIYPSTGTPNGLTVLFVHLRNSLKIGMRSGEIECDSNFGTFSGQTAFSVSLSIHFLALMRLTLVVLKYLDLVNADSDQNAATYDSSLDDLAIEVEAILSDWNVDELISTTKSLIDTWFFADILFTSYKIIIILSQAKKCNRASYHLPRHTVDLARKSLKVFQCLMGSTVRSFWGVSILLIHQFIFFFLLCLDIIDCQEPENNEEGLALVRWVNEMAVKLAENRPELGPITLVTRSMTAACEQVHLGR